MATRFYFPASGVAPISPAVDTNWTSSTGLGRFPLIRKSLLDTVTTLANRNDAGAVGTSSQNICNSQFISEPLPANVLIAGNVSLAILCVMASGGGASLTTIVRTISNDGSVLGNTLLFLTSIDTPFGTTAATRILTTFLGALTPANGKAGDRIVVEMGTNRTSPTNGTTAGQEYGTSGGSDYALTSGLTTVINPWIEFSQDLWPIFPNNYQFGGKGDMSFGDRVR